MPDLKQSTCQCNFLERKWKLNKMALALGSFGNIFPLSISRL